MNAGIVWADSKGVVVAYSPVAARVLASRWPRGIQRVSTVIRAIRSLGAVLVEDPLVVLDDWLALQAWRTGWMDGGLADRYEFKSRWVGFRLSRGSRKGTTLLIGRLLEQGSAESFESDFLARVAQQDSAVGEILRGFGRELSG